MYNHNCNRSKVMWNSYNLPKFGFGMSWEIRIMLRYYWLRSLISNLALSHTRSYHPGCAVVDQPSAMDPLIDEQDETGKL